MRPLPPPAPRRPAGHRVLSALAASLTTLSALACAGTGAPAVEDLPVYGAEPVALIDLPGDERPTGLALLPGGVAASFALLGRSEAGLSTSAGGVRFRALDGSALDGSALDGSALDGSAVDGTAPDGGALPHADLEPEVNVDASALALSPDATRLAVARFDRVDLVPLDGGEARSLPLSDREDRSAEGLLSHCTAPWQLAWGGGTLVARCAVGVPMVMLDVATGARTLPLPRTDADGAHVTVNDLAIAGETLAVLGASDDYTAEPRPWVELRALRDGALARRIPLDRPFQDVAVSPDGARLAVSHPYWGLRVLDATDGRVLAEHTYPEDWGNRGSGDVAWSADGARLYRVGRRLSVTVHDAADARVLGYLPAHPDEPENPMPPPADWPPTLGARNGTLALSADERLLASIERSDFGRGVRVWRLPEAPPER